MERGEHMKVGARAAVAALDLSLLPQLYTFIVYTPTLRSQARCKRGYPLESLPRQQPRLLIAPSVKGFVYFLLIIKSVANYILFVCFFYFYLLLNNRSFYRI